MSDCVKEEEKEEGAIPKRDLPTAARICMRIPWTGWAMAVVNFESETREVFM